MERIKYEAPRLRAFKMNWEQSFLATGGTFDGNGGIEGGSAGLADDWDN